MVMQSNFKGMSGKRKENIPSFEVPFESSNKMFIQFDPSAAN